MIDLTSPDIAAAAANIAIGIILVIVSLYFFITWRQKDLVRKWIALSYLMMGVLGAVVYWGVIFIDPALTIILRIGWMLWDIISIGVLLWVHTVETSRFDYQCRQKIDELNDRILNLLQANEVQMKTIRVYQEKSNRLEVQVGDLERALARLTADLVTPPGAVLDGTQFAPESADNGDSDE